MAVDLSGAEEQREAGATIPDGTFVKMVMNIRAGGVTVPGNDPMDNGLFKASGSSDAMGLDAEFTVTAGPYAHRKVFSWMTISGGALDDKGNSKGWNMTKTSLRAMIDSALGLDPKDTSPAAAQARRVGGFAQFSGIEFWAKIGIEPGNEIMQNNQGTGRFYDDKNVIERIVVPGDAEYADLRAGKEVAAKPKHQASVSGARAATPSASTAAAKPAWGGGGAVASPSASPPAQPSLPGTAAAPAATTAPQGGPAWLRQ